LGATKQPASFYPSENVNDSAVELNGIEPSASRVRCENTARQCKDFEQLERQGTSENGPERPILATCRQNSAGPDLIGDHITKAAQAWCMGRDRRALRKALLAILTLLDE
jgi:hypothetical protein